MQIKALNAKPINSYFFLLRYWDPDGLDVDEDSVESDGEDEEYDAEDEEYDGEDDGGDEIVFRKGWYVDTPIIQCFRCFCSLNLCVKYIVNNELMS